MTFEPFGTGDIEPFLQMAATENWVVDPWEFNFLLSEFPQGCFTARHESGDTAGFVTAIRHERSGWIGNLIVAEKFRGLGIGEDLFKKAMEALHDSGVETIWLTASSSGQALYEKYGFRSIDRIIRWVGTGRERHCADSVAVCPGALALSINIDAFAWGDNRKALLEATASRGQLIQRESGFIVRQQFGDIVQLGPFSTMDAGDAEQLLDEGLRTVPSGTKVCIDAPVSNSTVLTLYNRRRMRISGSNELMYAGTRPAYRAENIYGLATMGSCG